MSSPSIRRLLRALHQHDIDVQKYAFVHFPEDWRGRVVEIFPDGLITLDSGMFSHERKARGEAPRHTLLIESHTTRDDILGFLSAWRNSQAEILDA